MADYYVRASGGSDANDGLSFANGFATVQKGFDSVTAVGDRVLICDDGTHLPTARIDIDSFAPSNSNLGVNVIGCNSTGTPYTGPGEYATISGASLPANTPLVYVNTTGLQSWYFTNLRFTAATQDGFDGSFSNVTSFVFFNCRFDNNARHGLYTNKNLTRSMIRNCRFDNNGSNGVLMANTGDIVGSIFDNNGAAGLECSSAPNSDFTNCVFFKNGTHGVTLPTTSSTRPVIRSCTFAFNTNDGLNIASGSNQPALSIINNIFANNGGYGVNGPANTSVLAPGHVDYNLYYSNTSGHRNNLRDNYSGNLDDINPQFTNTTSGSEDLTPQAGSPAIAAGFVVGVGPAGSGFYQGVDIGAINRDTTGDGGGGGEYAAAYIGG